MKTLKIDGSKIDSFDNEDDLTAYLASVICNDPDNDLHERRIIEHIEGEYQMDWKTENERNYAIVSEITEFNDGIHFER